MLQLNGGKPCYTSPYTKQNLPASLTGGKETAQALTNRLRPLLEADREKGKTGKDPLRHGFAVPPLPEGEASGRSVREYLLGSPSGAAVSRQAD